MFNKPLFMQLRPYGWALAWVILYLCVVFLTAFFHIANFIFFDLKVNFLFYISQIDVEGLVLPPLLFIIIDTLIPPQRNYPVRSLLAVIVACLMFFYFKTALFYSNIETDYIFIAWAKTIYISFVFLSLLYHKMDIFTKSYGFSKKNHPRGISRDE